MTTSTPALGDLDARRIQRAQARAAQREGAGEVLPIVFGGQVITELNAEFSLDVLSPLQDIKVDISMLIKQAVDNATSDDASQANIDLVINILAAHPDLPRDLIVAIKEMGRRLLGNSGYEAFVAQRPSPWDVAALVSILFSWYGTSLGEVLRSSSSSGSNGGTSNTTSGTASDSTPGESGSGQASPDSSALDGSPV